MMLSQPQGPAAVPVTGSSPSPATRDTSAGGADLQVLSAVPGVGRPSMEVKDEPEDPSSDDGEGQDDDDDDDVVYVDKHMTESTMKYLQG